MSLSLDVSLTVMELGKLALYLAIYWGVHGTVRRFGPRFVTHVIIGAGVAGAVVLIVHKILILDTIYGFYKPIFAAASGERICAPLLNENHMAAFLGLCTAVAIGRAFSASGRSERATGLGIAAFIGGATVLTLSRGGIAAFIAGQCLFIVLRLWRRFRRTTGSRRTESIAWLPVGLALALGLGLFAAQDAVVGEFLSGNVRKLDFIKEGVPLIGRFWTTGIGRGAFRVGFHMVSGLGGNITATHAENAVVQLLADLGIFMGGATLLAAAVFLGRFLLRPPDRVEHAALLSGLVGFAIHNLIDFNMEIIGVAVVATAAISTLQSSRSSYLRNGDVRKIPIVVVYIVTALCFAASIAAVTYARPFNLDAEEAKFRHALTADDAPVFHTNELEKVLKRHPADAYIPFIVGVRTYQRRAGNPLPWFARAVTLNPRFPEAHFYIAGTLLRADRLSQAMLEFRLAARAEPGLAFPAANLLVARIASFDTLSKIAVTDDDKRRLWPALASALALRGASDEAEKADKAVLSVNPRHARSAARQVRRLISRDEFEEAAKLAASLKAAPETELAGILLESEILEKQGAWKRSVEHLESAEKRFGDDPVLLERLAWALLRAGDPDGALHIAGILKSKTTTVHERARAVVLEAKLLNEAKRFQSALSKLREARALEPDNVAVLRKIFVLSNKQGDRPRALEALRALVRLIPADAELKATLTQYETPQNATDKSVINDNP